MSSRELAAAVLRQAVFDVHHPQPDVRQRAEAWLQQPGEYFRFWCDVAGLDTRVVKAAVTRTLATAHEESHGD